MTEITLPIPKERTIYLAQQINQDSINSLTKTIVDIEENDIYLKKLYYLHDLEYKPKPIKLYIDSYGGNVYQCLGLVNIMDKCKTKIHTIVTGCAMSCGFIIAISGHKRFGYNKSTYMYHQASSGAFGTVKEIEDELIEVKRLQKIMEDITVEKTDIPKKKLKEIFDSKTDWYITSEDALKMKIIDEII